jgi:hypothetical protein
MRRADVPRTVAVGGMLVVVDLSLRTLGLRRTLAWVRRLANGRPQDADPGVARELVERSARRVAKAAAFHPGRAECLEQSLVLWLFLRRRGIPAELRIGVQTRPFMAHAWVEYESRPVNERTEYVEGLAAFPAIGG